ncbi:MAG TPA: ribonucleoside triphosphate reductase [Nanoarchaeota archaeon]|nr:ribonucleoside triphosphate reductase [Nanoarchaeota archaeon]
MISQIKKRTGEIVLFNKNKISEAIFRAAKSVGGTDRGRSDELAEMVVELLGKRGFNEKDIPSVEDVQDAVEKTLIEEGHAQTAKAYIIYREQHKRIREFQSFVNSNEIMDGYLNLLDWRVKENSNMSYSLQGLNNHISSIVSSNYWLHKVYPPEVRNAHIEGDLHLHDLQILSAYCCGWDLQELLVKGFGGVSEKVESKPAKHFRAILGQITNFFYTLQGESAGAQAVSNVSTLLAPFIRYDKLNYKETKQALQEFIFNMNVPTRVGFQTPFTNITIDLTVPDMLKHTPVIIGGKVMPETYGEFQNEIDTINKAYIEVMAEGDAKGRVFTFPIPTYNITKNLDWDNPVLDDLFEITSKLGIPYFGNFVNSEMQPDDVRSMCCRLRLDNRELRKRSGGLFAANPLTGSLGVVTLNMPRAAYTSKNETEFMERVLALMKIAKDSLDIKRKSVENFTEKGLYPYARRYLSGVKESSGKYWNNHFNTIGLIGMNEACLNLFGTNIASTEGRKFALKTLDIMRNELKHYQDSTNDSYNLEATPGEGCSYRLAKMDKAKFPNILTAGKEVPYYTNSTHLPVGYTDDIFEALDHQDELQCKYTGGTVLHGFVGERISDSEACKQLVKKIVHNYKLPYFTITPTFSVCPDHGYLKGEKWLCSHETGNSVCGKGCEVFSRVVGYYRPVQSWNDGKREEFKERKEYCEKRSLESASKKGAFKFSM